MLSDIPTNQPVVLIVDDRPDNLALLSSTLASSGYAVLVALDGVSALERIERMMPDVILLDAMMPGMDGFETCERIKSKPMYRHIPVIFMTALTESHHVVNGFRVGGVDYVTKPIRPDEVIARIAAHVKRAATQRHADIVLALNARSAAVVTAGGEVQWHSDIAPMQLAKFFAQEETPATEEQMLVSLPKRMRDWLRRYVQAESDGVAAHQEFVEVNEEGDRLVAKIAGQATRGSWIVVFEEHADRRDIVTLERRFALTRREAEVLLWLSRGKTNHSISEILHMMPRTVNKHLEHVFSKLHVETRTAATAAALQAIR